MTAAKASRSYDRQSSTRPHLASPFESGRGLFVLETDFFRVFFQNPRPPPVKNFNTRVKGNEGPRDKSTLEKDNHR